MHYEAELKTKDLKTLFKPFASLQNRILIDYKKLRDFLLTKLKEREEDNGKNGHRKQSSQTHTPMGKINEGQREKRVAESGNKINKSMHKILEDSRIYT